MFNINISYNSIKLRNRYTISLIHDRQYSSSVSSSNSSNNFIKTPQIRDITRHDFNLVFDSNMYMCDNIDMKGFKWVNIGSGFNAFSIYAFSKGATHVWSLENDPVSENLGQYIINDAFDSSTISAEQYNNYKSTCVHVTSTYINENKELFKQYNAIKTCFFDRSHSADDVNTIDLTEHWNTTNTLLKMSPNILSYRMHIITDINCDIRNGDNAKTYSPILEEINYQIFKLISSGEYKVDIASGILNEYFKKDLIMIDHVSKVKETLDKETLDKEAETLDKEAETLYLIGIMPAIKDNKTLWKKYTMLDWLETFKDGHINKGDDVSMYHGLSRDLEYEVFLYADEPIDYSDMKEICNEVYCFTSIDEFIDKCKEINDKYDFILGDFWGMARP